MKFSLVTIACTLLVYSTYTLPEPVIFTGILTPMVTSIRGGISNRHQEHMWVTEDEAIHVIVAGTESGPHGLNIYSTLDQGMSWFSKYEILDTEKKAKPDVFYLNGELLILYKDSNQNPIILKLNYDTSRKAWVYNQIITLKWSDSSSYPDKMTLTVDNNARIWVALAQIDKKSHRSLLRIGFLDNNAEFRLLETEFGYRNLSKRKSARILRFSDGIGLVYVSAPDSYSEKYNLSRAHHYSYWDDEIWPSETIAELDGSTDPNGVHYSATVDALDQFHVVSTSKKNLLYFRWTPFTSGSDGPVILGQSNPYVQVGISNENMLYVAGSNNEADMHDVINIFESSDYGNNFFLKNYFIYKPQKDFGHSFVEIPSRNFRSLPALRELEFSEKSFGFAFFLDE